MSKIIILADGAPFNSRILNSKPLGGAETACIRFAESLATQGHELCVYTTANETYDDKGVHWRRLADFKPNAADIVMAHRSPHLFSRYPIQAKRKVLYVHNPTQYLSKWKHRHYLYQHKPDVIFSGQYHASTWPRFLPNTAHHIIPYAVDNLFLQATPRATPPPRAIFTSNPLRSLDWVLDIWQHQIHPQCPSAELHLYCGPSVYPGLAADKARAMQAILDQAHHLHSHGVIIHEPLPKHHLISALKQSRVMLYRGDLGESFCLALAEAQALGVPAVTAGIGSCSERVIHNQTGFICQDKAGFATAALRLLSDDLLWQQQHKAALTTQAGYCWQDAADKFDVYYKTEIASSVPSS